MGREKVFPICPNEARNLSAWVYDFPEVALRQALLGMIQVLTFKPSITLAQFIEILSDASRYVQIKKQP